MSFKRTLKKNAEQRRVKTAQEAYKEGYQDGMNRMASYVATKLEDIKTINGIGKKRFAQILEILDYQDNG